MASLEGKKYWWQKPNWKRILAVALTFAMMVSGVPFQADDVWGGIVRAEEEIWNTDAMAQKSGAVSGYQSSLSSVLAKSGTVLTGDQATWGFNEKLCDGFGTTQSTLEKKEGTFENNNGDILYVDANSGKFAPNLTSERIQVNAGTKVYIPVKGNKISLSVLLHKQPVGTEETVLSETFSISGIDDNLLAEAQCTKIETDATDSNYKLVTIECYADGTEGEILLTALQQMYVRSITITCETLSTVTISGTVTSNEALLQGTQVIVCNTVTNVQHAADLMFFRSVIRIF